MPWTHGNLVSKLRRRGGREGEPRMLSHVWMGTLYVCSQANTGSLFWNRLITSDSNLFLFCKYTNHLQILFASVFTKLSWQAQTFLVYIKQENEWVWISVSVCACAATRVVEGGAGVGLAKLLVETQGLGQGPSGEAGPFTSAHKMAAVAVVLAGLFMGDNGPKSKTDSLLRGNGEPASELIKQVLCISEGAACLMSDTGRGIHAGL